MAFIQEYCIKLIHSTLYYAQPNRQTKAINKIFINMIKKALEDKPKKWQEVLSKVLWVYQNTKCTTIDLTPYWLTYGQEVVLPLEIIVKSLRVTR